MAIGVQKKANNTLEAEDPTNLDKTIGTLKRCLEMTGASIKNNQFKSINSMAEELTDLTLEEAVPEASKWPHCQHMISQDEARNEDIQGNIRLVTYKPVLSVHRNSYRYYKRTQSSSSLSRQPHEVCVTIERRRHISLHTSHPVSLASLDWDTHPVWLSRYTPAGLHTFLISQGENHIGDIMRLITKDLSEPYSIYTYRYFLHNWPDLCFLAYDSTSNLFVGAVLCKLEMDNGRSKGYLAMLAVDEACRRLGLGTRLVRRAIDAMIAKGCDEVVLETEVSNKNAQRLYSNLGFIREKRLLRYYLNGGDAFRLKLIFKPKFHRRASQKENEQYGCCENGGDYHEEEQDEF